MDLCIRHSRAFADKCIVSEAFAELGACIAAWLLIVTAQAVTLASADLNHVHMRLRTVPCPDSLIKSGTWKIKIHSVFVFRSSDMN
jgi:hypothetical protein